MPNFKLLIEYNGTAYAGWQRQKNSRTIQGEIEKALKKLFNQRINLIGSGRTDAGVHALGQIANFSLDTKLLKAQVRKALNFHLPEDIRVKKIVYANSRFHSRFSAKSKIYRYFIVQEYSPFLKDRVYFYPDKLNLDDMNKAARHLLGRHNFRSFQNQGSSRQTSVVTLQRVRIKKVYLNPAKRPALIIEIEANAFLYRMARNIVGLLLEVGKGKIKPQEVKSILAAENRRRSSPPVPAQGLYLWRVKY